MPRNWWTAEGVVVVEWKAMTDRNRLEELSASCVCELRQTLSSCCLGDMCSNGRMLESRTLEYSPQWLHASAQTLRKTCAKLGIVCGIEENTSIPCELPSVESVRSLYAELSGGWSAMCVEMDRVLSECRGTGSAWSRNAVRVQMRALLSAVEMLVNGIWDGDRMSAQEKRVLVGGVWSGLDKVETMDVRSWKVVAVEVKSEVALLSDVLRELHDDGDGDKDIARVVESVREMVKELYRVVLAKENRERWSVDQLWVESWDGLVDGLKRVREAIEDWICEGDDEDDERWRAQVANRMRAVLQDNDTGWRFIAESGGRDISARRQHIEWSCMAHFQH